MIEVETQEHVIDDGKESPASSLNGSQFLLRGGQRYGFFCRLGLEISGGLDALVAVYQIVYPVQLDGGQRPGVGAVWP